MNHCCLAYVDLRFWSVSMPRTGRAWRLVFRQLPAFRRRWWLSDWRRGFGSAHLISADHSSALLTDSQVMILLHRLRRKPRTNNVGSAFKNKENFTEMDQALIQTIMPQTGISVRSPRAVTLWAPICCKSMFLFRVPGLVFFFISPLEQLIPREE